MSKFLKFHHPPHPIPLGIRPVTITAPYLSLEKHEFHGMILQMTILMIAPVPHGRICHHVTNPNPVTLVPGTAGRKTTPTPERAFAAILQGATASLARLVDLTIKPPQ